MSSPPPGGGGGGLYRDSPPRKKSKHKAFIETEINFPYLSSKTNQQDNPKFVSMKSTDAEKPLNKLNIFLLSKALNGVISESNRIFTKFTRDGNILILTKTKRQADLLIKTKKLANVCDITCSYHDNLNTVKGVIFCPELKDLTEDEIKFGLSDQNVTEVQKIKKMVDGKATNTPLHILLFDLYKLPPEIKIGFQLYKVDHYVPKPMQCKNCNKIGHTQKRCQNAATCSICSLTLHNGEELCTQVKCINCSMQHRSTNKNCPKIKKRQEIIKHSTINRTSIAEATEYINLNFAADHFTKNTA